MARPKHYVLPPLSMRQEAFCQAICAGLTNNVAYIQAGYSAAKSFQGYAPANRLLKSPRIVARIAELRAPAVAKAQVSAERIIGELAKVAFFDLGKLFDSHGKLLPPDRIPEDVRAAMHIECTPGARRRYKISAHDKLRALDQLTRMIGAYQQPDGGGGDPAEQRVNNTLVIMDLRSTRLVDGQLVPLKAIEAPQ